MKTLIVNIEDELSEKAIRAVLDALRLEYDIEDDKEFQDETARIMANPYLVEKLTQSRQDMANGKGVKIDIEDLWK